MIQFENFGPLLLPENQTLVAPSSGKNEQKKITTDEIKETYTAPLSTELANIDLDLLTGTEHSY